MGFLGDHRSPPRLVGVLGSAPCLLPASVQLVAIGFGQPSLEQRTAILRARTRSLFATSAVRSTA